MRHPDRRTSSLCLTDRPAVRGQVLSLGLLGLLLAAGCDAPATAPETSAPGPRLGSLGDLESGNVVAWGGDDFGQVGQTPSGDDFVMVSAGSSHTVALREDGSLAAWGADASGQVSGTPAGDGFVAVSAGGEHSLALHEDGTIDAWGASDPVAGTPTGDGFVAISAGDHHSLALRDDGTIAAWGDGSVEQGQVEHTPTGDGYVGVSAGGYHSLALRVDGGVEAWGALESPGDEVFPVLRVRVSWGQVKGMRSLDGDFVAVSAGRFHSLALRADGTLLAMGRDEEGQVSGVPTTGDVVALSAGRHHNLARREDGALTAWGADGEGQVSDVPTDAGFIALSAGGLHSLAIRGVEPDAIDLVDSAREEVETIADAGDLGHGETTSLLRKLDMATAMLHAGKSRPACNLLEAFVNEVEALVAVGTLAVEDGAELVALAEEAMADACG